MTPAEALPWLQAVSAPVTAIVAGAAAVIAASIQASGNRASATINAAAVDRREDQARNRRLINSRARLLALANVLALDVANCIVNPAQKRPVKTADFQRYLDTAYSDNLIDALNPEMLAATYDLADTMSSYYNDKDLAAIGKKSWRTPS